MDWRETGELGRRGWSVKRDLSKGVVHDGIFGLEWEIVGVWQIRSELLGFVELLRLEFR